MENIQPHQQRVLVEKIELDEKIELLSNFIDSSLIFKGLDNSEKDRLSRQLEYMRLYSGVLEERIESWGIETKKNIK